MKLAILSDIHANLEALDRCFGYLDEECTVDGTAVLGDIIGYGADPVKCIQQVKDRADIVVIGNHDAAIIGTTNIDYFNIAAREVVLWTRTQISEEDQTYLAELPYKMIQDNICFTHSTPNKPEEWKYIFSWFDAEDEFHYLNESLCFVGHSHVPGIFEQTTTITHDNGPVRLDPDTKYIINVGSVGQPRDGDPRLSFAVLDLDSGTVEIIRLEYNIETARKKIIENSLPPFLGDRILYGR